MHDLRMIRENPSEFDAAMTRRGLGAQSPSILSLDEKRRAIQTQLQDLQAQRNEKSKEIGKVKSQGGDAQPIMDAVSAMKEQMTALEEQERALGAELTALVAALPNIMADDVPDGEDEDDNVEVRKIGEITNQAALTMLKLVKNWAWLILKPRRKCPAHGLLCSAAQWHGWSVHLCNSSLIPIQQSMAIRRSLRHC